MTDNSTDQTDVNDTIARGEALLNGGETERLIAEARKTIAAARLQGRLDIVEKAGQVIENLVEKHTALAGAHGQLLEAKAELESAKAHLLATRAQQRS